MKIYIMGDSHVRRMKGIFHKSSVVSPRRLHEQNVRFLGLGGRTVRRELTSDTMLENASCFNLDWIFLLLGGNDVRHHKADVVFSDLKSFYRDLLDISRNILIVPIPPRYRLKAQNKEIIKINKLCKEWSEGQDRVFYLNMRHTRPNRFVLRNDKGEDVSDGIHLNERGYGGVYYEHCSLFLSIYCMIQYILCLYLVLYIA
jgi:hypothetical protein